MGKGETPRSDECLILGKDSISSRTEYIILPLSLCSAPEPGRAAVGWGPPWFLLAPVGPLCSDALDPKRELAD